MFFTRFVRASVIAAFVPIGVIVGGGAGSARADVFVYNVSIPTDSLNTNIVNGPFTIVASLADGSGTNDGNNTVTLTGFNVVGPPATISLTDTSPIVFDQELITPNAGPFSTLDFTLSTTNNADVGGTPDNFSFYIYDGGSPSNPLPTTDPGSSLFYINLGGFTPSVTTFQGTDPYEGLDATVTPVPEPSMTLTLSVALMGLAGLIVFRKRNSYCKL